MTHREKVDAAVADLVARGVGRGAAAPFPYRILWWLGFAVRPPHYQSFLTLTALNTFLVWLAVAVPLCLTLSSHEPEPLALSLAVMLPFALICGLTVAAYYRVSARRLELPAWDQFDPPDAAEDEW